MSDDAQDAAAELGPPPERGLVVRSEEHGFYVRLQPLPSPQLPVVAGVMAVFGLVGGGLALVASPEPLVQGWILVGSMAFGLLLWGLSFGQGFFPIELIGDERSLAWAGDRYAWSQIAACRAEGGTLHLVGPGERIIAQAKHLVPEAADWTARLVTLSLEHEAAD